MQFFERLSWLLQLRFRGRFNCKTKQIKPPLPDDIIVDILSRLSADDVLKYRRVCRAWLRLTSTPQFTELHLQRAAVPILFVHFQSMRSILYDTELIFFFLDENAKKRDQMKAVRSRSALHKIGVDYAPTLVGSCNGLLLFKPYEDDDRPLTSKFFVCNPITDEVITLKKPFMKGYLIGIFYHSFTKEYRILYVHCNQYLILTLGRGRNQWRRIGTFAYLPRISCLPVRINQTLYWIVECYNEEEAGIPTCENSIMGFNIDTEEFTALAHPGNECYSRQMHKQMHLLDMDGQLLYCCVSNELIHGWILDDSASWDWTKTFKINLDWIVKCYPLREEDGYDYGLDLKNIQSKDLLLVWSARGVVFRCNVETNMIKVIKLTRIKKFDSIHLKVSLISYSKSLVSFKCFYGGYQRKALSC